MKEKAELLFVDFAKAINNLQYAVEHYIDDLDIDGSIKRFELSYELAWKLMKQHLSVTGIICKNPRDCFKSAMENGLLDNEVNWLKMIDDRNKLVHVYTFEESRKIFEEIKLIHAGSLSRFYNRIKVYYNKT